MFLYYSISLVTLNLYHVMYSFNVLIMKYLQTMVSMCNFLSNISKCM